MTGIAIIGMACRYAEARSPMQLWENVLAQRQSFRHIPRVRLNLADYSAEVQAADNILPVMAALLDDYEFDRSRFHISRDAFAATDLSHWLALDVASQALEDAKLQDSPADQRERTAVYVGNSLTGEFSRANLMRLRWPYVRRVLAAASKQNGSGHEITEDFLATVEALYKAPFPATNEESLAGGLSNTIAGRICNYFDFKGGGYTVDGACASSLLAVATACSALHSGDVDVAIAGGVDLSLDPFELAGFSSLGALAPDKMRVFDAHSSGFWPGEGCGIVVLMRQSDAVEHHRLPYAVIHGWGISSDGQGGITRPEISGQMLALRRAYARSGYGIDDVAYFEGHGTGTSIGDATELQALSRARSESTSHTPPAALGSIKANIGHTKAAAGVAGLMKATMAVHTRILPPTTGCDDLHPELASKAARLRVLRKAEPWPGATPVRAGINGFGFGGINVHVTLEASDARVRKSFTIVEQEQISSAQDCELFIFAARDTSDLHTQLAEALEFIDEASYSGLTDLSIFLARQADAGGSGKPVRAACVASTPAEAGRALRKILAWCEAGTGQRIDLEDGTFFSTTAGAPRIGFLFSGQSSPVYIDGGIWSRRFPSLRDLYAQAALPRQHSVHTQTAQPCIVAASLAGLHMLRAFGIQGSLAVGHSLGEITALHWAGACSESDLIRTAHARGKAMAEAGDPSGAMASIRAGYADVLKRLNGDDLVIAARNGPSQTVVSGKAGAVRRFTEKLRSQGVSATMLQVSHAFHSPLVAEVATAFSGHLSSQRFASLDRRVISTVTAAPLASDADLKILLSTQITSPVLFAEALTLASGETDLFLEVGPGSVLSGIVRESTDKLVIALDAGGKSLRGLLSAVACAFALGAEIQAAPLYQNRFGRPVNLKKRLTFLANPCETVPESILPRLAREAAAPAQQPVISTGPENFALEALRGLVAQKTQLPLSAIKAEHRFLGDLHLNSITISQIILETASRLKVAAPVAPAEFTNATLAETAVALEQHQSLATAEPTGKHPAGVDSWIRVLGVKLLEKPLRAKTLRSTGKWELMGDADHSFKDHSFKDRLREEFQSVAGEGLVCCVPAERDLNTASLLVQSAQTALKQGVQQIVFVQHASGAGALARTLFLENPKIRVAVVNVPLKHPASASWVAAEAAANHGFVEAHYGKDGVRREPRLELMWPQRTAGFDGLNAGDVLLVTGGGKGIAAESAFHLARLSGCRLALIGRSDPAQDAELASNLDRFAQAGVVFRYFAADLTDRDSVSRALQNYQAEFGPITALLHGAGNNHPKRLEEVTTADLDQVLAPKLAGLLNLLDNVQPDKLRLLLTFGSIIARTGLHGEAHYGLANEWLALAVEKWREAHSQCRCLNLEWSVWGGIGMGQRLGVLDSLIRQGITPLPLDDAIEQLKAMIEWKEAPAAAIITGRFGNLPTLKFHQPALPLLRFLEHPRLYLPEIELIVDADLSKDSDAYVAEHEFQSEQLFPAVMGMEAMAQVAKALEQTDRVPSFRNLRFARPIIVPHHQPVTIRIAALRRRPGVVSAVIRCSSTGFQVEHFSGECVFDENQVETAGSQAARIADRDIPLDPSRDLYGPILFQSGRFSRVEAYQLLRSDLSIARLRPPTQDQWFARHLSPELALGDSASRDAALHSIQACIPHKTILPVGVDRITAGAGWTIGSAHVHATERSSDGDNLVYDLRIENADGEICEQWEGLRLRAVSVIETHMPWPLALLAPYLERSVRQTLARADIKVRLAPGSTNTRAQTNDKLLREMHGPDAALIHRPDGKPEVTGVPGPMSVSISHSCEFMLLLTASSAAGCDLERIAGRKPEDWEQLLGAEHFALAQQFASTSGASIHQAATQIWALKEGLRKAGACFTQPVSFISCSAGNWASFSAGAFKCATVHAQVEEAGSAVAFAFVIHS
jgi:enediyne polyketide synthase